MRSDISDKKKTWAFTLIELMVVVAIIGMLASVAIPSFAKYIKRSKTSEVYPNIRKIYDGEVMYFNQDMVGASGTAVSKQFVVTFIQPSWPPGVNKRKGDFSAGNWPLTQFAPDSALQYIYFVDAYPFPSPYPFRPAQFDITGSPPGSFVAAFRVMAVGDIDGDGTYSSFERGYGVKADGTQESEANLYIVDILE